MWTRGQLSICLTDYKYCIVSIDFKHLAFTKCKCKAENKIKAVS